MKMRLEDIGPWPAGVQLGERRVMAMSADTLPLAHAPAVGSVHADGENAVVVRFDGTRYRMSPRTARELAAALQEAAGG